jgi:carbon-monoxide dehydrogenase iron sulfur subunit
MARIKVSVERINGSCNLPHLVGDYFYVDGSRLLIPEGRHVCLWALQSMMPIFPILSVKDRLDAGHWIGKVKTFSCPDPQGLVQFRLEVVDEPGTEPESSPPAPALSGPRPRRRKKG